jgi:putative DNA primase/helicase
MRQLTVTVGEASKGLAHAQGRTVKCTWPQFVRSMIADVPETDDKSAAGWVCGAEFERGYRHSKNFIARHLLSFDYDHITPEDLLRIRSTYGGYAGLLHPTWSSTPSHPRFRLWLPLSRPVGDDEFEAVSRRVAARAGIELAARETHTPAQYMFRPAVPPFAGFEATVTEGAWVDVDQILGEYDDWTDRSTWPHRAEGDGVGVSKEEMTSPLEKTGIVGAFNRAFSIEEAIERFELPYQRVR